MNQKPFNLPVLTKRQINSILKNRPLEDIPTLLSIEKILKSKRGHVFKTPKKNTPVILLLSGGLDTSIIWDILLRKYELNVYPLFIRRGQIRMPLEEKAVNDFANYYKNKYPSLFHPPFKVTTAIPPLEIRWNITKYADYSVSHKPTSSLGLPLYSSELFNSAVQYAYYLQFNKNIVIRDIFCGFMPSDGTLYRYETLTSIRSNNYNICNLTGDFSWQLSSLALEKELGFIFEKETLIEWAHSQDLPVQLSNSCIKFSYFQCGKCGFCLLRKKSFLTAGISDKTVYLVDMYPQLLYKILNKLSLLFETLMFLLVVWLSFVKNFLYFFKHRY